MWIKLRVRMRGAIIFGKRLYSWYRNWSASVVGLALNDFVQVRHRLVDIIHFFLREHNVISFQHLPAWPYQWSVEVADLEIIVIVIHLNQTTFVNQHFFIVPTIIHLLYVQLIISSAWTFPHLIRLFTASLLEKWRS